MVVENRNILIVLFFVLLACTACGESDVKTIKFISADIDEPEIIEYNETEEPVVNSTREPNNPYLDHDYSDPLNHSQLPTSKPNELKRYKLYGTLFDLTDLSVDDCEKTIKDIEEAIWDAEDDIKDAEEDVLEAQTYLDEQYEQKAKAVEADDKYKIEDENEDIHDADLWLWEEKEKLTQAQRTHIELEQTLEAVEDECARLGYDD